MHTRSPRKKTALLAEGFLKPLQKIQQAKKKLFAARKRRKDALSKETTAKVHTFYLRKDISCILPDKRYARKEGPGYLLQQTLSGAYRIFVQDNPDVKIGYTKFTKLRPKNVRKISSSFSETCVCVYCFNVKLKLQALNYAVSTSGCCSEKILDERGLINILLCEKGVSKFLAAACVQGSCHTCEDIAATLTKHFQDLLTSNPIVTWNRWCRINKEGRTVHEPVTRRATAKELMAELIEDLRKPTLNTTFVQHLFKAWWQQDQYRRLKEELKPDQVMLVMDFAENRKAQFQDEVRQQITFHPVIAYYWQPNNTAGQLVRHTLDFLSDDIQHDYHAVHAFTERTISHLRELGGVRPGTELYIFSDGCAAQYKGKGTFADLTNYTEPIQRIYFGSEHGKGEADGETGVVGKSVETAVLCRKVSF